MGDMGLMSEKPYSIHEKKEGIYKSAYAFKVNLICKIAYHFVPKNVMTF